MICIVCGRQFDRYLNAPDNYVLMYKAHLGVHHAQLLRELFDLVDDVDTKQDFNFARAKDIVNLLPELEKEIDNIHL